MRSRPGIAVEIVPWWRDLFGGGEPRPTPRRVRILHKAGQPFLVLPTQPELAATALGLYPGQRWQARRLRDVLTLLLRARLPAPGTVTELPVAPAAPLPEFLAALAGQPQPPFAVLAGNPGDAGRRFIVLVWQPDGAVAAVVKVGATAAARELIQQEAGFLQRLPASVPGIPRLLRSFQAGPLAGFALPYVPGRSPAGLTAGVVQLLRGWLQPERRVKATEIGTWQRLKTAGGDDPAWRRVAECVEAQPFAAAVTHGDFTPWNLRGTDPRARAWALDWERGEAPGMPAWDWFHFVIQPAILVQRQRGAALVQVCERLLRGEEFRAYAAAAGLAGRERAMLLAYLHHVIYQVRPGQGLTQNRELLEALLVTKPAVMSST
jgi:hypothetical protein